MSDKTVRIIANAHNKQIETVNIIAGAQLADNQKGRVKRHVQATSGQTSAAGHQIETFQDSGGTVKGLRSIHIPGYSSPN